MADWREPREVLEAAEQAAAAGDYTSAEELLREAAVLQENNFGSTDPNLANTLNNLGVVCEINQKPIDAEAFFRRAYAIATSTLQPDHPFVLTSRKNLEDFCRSQGKPFDPPSPSPVFDTGEDVALTDSNEFSLELPPGEQLQPVVSGNWSRRLVLGGLIAVGLFVGFAVNVIWLRWNDEAKSAAAISSSASPPSASATKSGRAKPPRQVQKTSSTDSGEVSAKTGVVPPTPPTSVQADAPSPSTTKGAKSLSKTAKNLGTTPNSVGTTASVPPSPEVAAAELCRNLSTSTWKCVRPGKQVGAGSLFYYTRLKSPTVTTVQHRWYRGDRLHRTVNLPVRVNTREGYRTYSRTSVDSKGGGDWRVELRTRDGVVLHEERFVVQ
jgi:hypothetical protein